MDGRGALQGPPKVLRDASARLTEPRLKSEAGALAALSACLPRGGARSGRYELAFPATAGACQSPPTPPSFAGLSREPIRADAGRPRAGRCWTASGPVTLSSPAWPATPEPGRAARGTTEYTDHTEAGCGGVRRRARPMPDRRLRGLGYGAPVPLFWTSPPHDQPEHEEHGVVG